MLHLDAALPPDHVKSRPLDSNRSHYYSSNTLWSKGIPHQQIFLEIWFTIATALLRLQLLAMKIHS